MRPAVGALLVTMAIAGCGSPLPQHALRLAALNTEQIRALDRAHTVIIIPVAILEQHGPYLPVYSDAYPAERLTDELAAAIAERPGWTAAAFPMIPLGHGGANEIGKKWIYPGSYTIRAATLRAVFMDLATEFGEQGFQWILVVTQHAAPNHHVALDQASDFFHDQYGGTMVNLFGLQPVFEARGGLELIQQDAAEDGFAVHAGLRETSDVLFHRPDLVAPGYRGARSLTGQSMADLVRLAEVPDWPGYFGAPRLASATLGGRAWRLYADVAIQTALGILDGRDYRSMPRYGTFSNDDPATAAVNQADAEQGERVAAQHRQWLESKGIR